MNLLSIVGELFKPAAELIDNIHTSEEERLNAKGRLLKTQTAFLESALEFETKALEAKSTIIVAEAKSEHVITAIWRPVTMLAFVGAILAYWFGLTPDDVPEEAVLAMFSLVKIGLGGYVVGRSAEKLVPGVLTALKKRDET